MERNEIGRPLCEIGEFVGQRKRPEGFAMPPATHLDHPLPAQPQLVLAFIANGVALRR